MPAPRFGSRRGDLWGNRKPKPSSAGKAARRGRDGGRLLASPSGRGAGGGEGGISPLSHFMTAPQSGSQGKTWGSGLPRRPKASSQWHFSSRCMPFCRQKLLILTPSEGFATIIPVLRNRGAAIRWRFCFLLFFAGGMHTLFHPLSFCGKGVARMTFTELCQFCLVLIGLAGLIIEIVNKKK